MHRGGGRGGEGSAAVLPQSHSRDSFTAGGKKNKNKKNQRPQNGAARSTTGCPLGSLLPFPSLCPCHSISSIFSLFPRLGTPWQEGGEEKRREARNGVKQQLCNFLAFAKAAAAHPIRPARRIRPTRPSLENIASKRQHTSALLKLRDPSMQ